jgi:phage terminase small subunit
MANGQLTIKQQRFVEEYLIDCNATQAAIRAGYSPETAQEQSSRLLSKAIIADAISAKAHKVSIKTELTAEKVLRDIEETRRQALEAGQFTAALKGSELQGKHLALFIERKEISGPNGAPIQFEGMTAEQKQQELEATLARLGQG